MSMFPGSGGSSIFRDGPGKGIAERVIETPYLAYAFLMALITCLLFYLLDHRKFVGVVQITLGVSISAVALLRNAQGHGWQYALIWIFGIIGCTVYTIDRLSNTDYTIH